MSDLSPETRDLLARGRHPAMPAKSRASLKRRVLAQAAAGSVVTTTATAAARLAIGKIVGLASVAAMVGAGAAVVSTREAPPTPQVVEAAPRAIVAPPAPVPTSPAIAMPAPSPVAPTVPAATALAVPARPSRPPPPPRPAPTPEATAAPAPVPLPPPVVAAPVALPAPVAPNRPSLQEDARLLREAHAALAAGNASAALALLDAHAARFPASALEPERSAERVFALCLAGRADDARSAAGAFLRAHPDGPLARRVRASCGGR